LRHDLDGAGDDRHEVSAGFGQRLHCGVDWLALKTGNSGIMFPLASASGSIAARLDQLQHSGSTRFPLASASGSIAMWNSARSEMSEVCGSLWVL
jgi:hypothetical protein